MLESFMLDSVMIVRDDELVATYKREDAYYTKVVGKIEKNKRIKIDYVWKVDTVDTKNLKKTEPLTTRITNLIENLVMRVI